MGKHKQFRRKRKLAKQSINLTLNKQDEEKCWFELQNDIKEKNKIKSIVPVCVAKFQECENICSVCYETFEVFYNNNAEDWMLRNALSRNSLLFHPMCYLDYNY